MEGQCIIENEIVIICLKTFLYFQCAALSPAIRVREFSVTDIQNYPVVLKWDAFPGEEGGEMEIFSTNHPVPFSKLLTFYRKEPFSVHAYYSAPTSYPEPYIGWYRTPLIPLEVFIRRRKLFLFIFYLFIFLKGKFTIKDVRPTAENEAATVKVKVRVNLHGILTVTGATLTEKLTQGEVESESKDSMEVDTNSQETMENGEEDGKDQGNEVRFE